MSLPWFRMYSEWASDPVVQSLAFEDQRHHAVLLCLKCNGTLDRDIADAQRERIIVRGLGLDPATAAEVKSRLLEVGLIDSDWQPNGWDKRQFTSDISTNRVRKYRGNKGTGNVPETLHETTGNSFGNAPDTEQNRADTEQQPLSGLPPDITPAEQKRNYTQEAETILDFLNEKAQRSYRAYDGNKKPTASLRIIIDRLKSGVSVDDCRSVVAMKCREWGTNAEMREYLRPETLFGAKKFEGYLGNLRRPK